MATDGPTPPPCNQEIFKNGKSILAIDGSSNAVENWVRSVAEKANAQVDWHYSGGVAHVLHLGDDKSFAKTKAVIDELEPTLNGRIIKRYDLPEEGLFRNGADQAPEGAQAGFYADGKTTFI